VGSFVDDRNKFVSYFGEIYIPVPDTKLTSDNIRYNIQQLPRNIAKMVKDELVITAGQCALVLAKSGILEQGDNILRTL